MSKPNVRQFNKLGTFGGKQWDYTTVVMACESNKILGVYKDLGSGNSLSDSFGKWGIDNSDLSFDVEYTKTVVVEPWCIEKMSDNYFFYAKVIWMLEPNSLFEVENVIPEDIDEAMCTLSSILEESTRLPFISSYNHIGNIELLYFPDRDANGKPYVHCKWDKTTFEFKVSILPLLTEGYERVIVNTSLKYNGVTLSDNVQFCKPTKERESEFVFGKNERIDTSVVKVWLQQGDLTKLVYDVTTHYIQRVNFQMSVSGEKTRVQTDWLDKLRNNLDKTKRKEIEKASLIARQETLQFHIGDRNVRQPRCKKAYPKIKTNDVFFPKGWDKETDVVGILGFLEWFKIKTNGAQRVFLQDPYFEDVALFFLASADSNCEYTILTQTSLKTNSNGTLSIVENGERKEKIINGIISYPRLFSPMKLIVKDMPGNGAKLHDRYLFFWYEKGDVEAYTLSNSLQGATLKQPLLITQIGDTAFERVSKHIGEIIEENNVKTLYDYKEKETKSIDCMEIADQGFYDWMISKKSLCLTDFVSVVLQDVLQNNTIAKISTLGYYLATSDNCEEIKKEILSQIKCEKKWVQTLKDYILVHHYDLYPNGYRNNKSCCFYHNDMSFFLCLRFDQIVSWSNIQLLDNICCESISNGVWGQYYAASLLSILSPDEMIDIIRLYKPTYDSILKDKTNEPICQSANVLFRAILDQALHGDTEMILNKLLNNHDDWSRAIGCLILLNKSINADFDPSSFIELLNDNKEIIILCNTAWAMVPKVADKFIFFKKLISAYCDEGDKELFLDTFIKLMRESHPLKEKKMYVSEVVLPLISADFVDKDIVCQQLIENLYDSSVCESSNQNEGNEYYAVQRVLPSTLSMVNGNIGSLISKVNQSLNKATGRINSLVNQNDEEMFRAFRPLIYLRNLLKSIIEEYKDNKENVTVKQILILMKEVDKMLDNAGFENTKKIYEYNC